MAYLSLRDDQEVARFERIAKSVDEGQRPWLADFLDKAYPVYRTCIQAPLIAASPFLFTAGERAIEVYQQLPKQACVSLWGLGVCFFGRRYTVTIAAAEAFKKNGGLQTWQCVRSLVNQASLVLEASRQEDAALPAEEKEKLTPTMIAQRKALLCLRTVDPDIVLAAWQGVASGYLGVLAVLKVQFAQTVAFAQSIAESIRPTVAKVLGPLVVHALPPDYRRWSGPLINVGCNLAAGYAAWKVQRVLSTVQCGIAGGLLAASSFLTLLREQGIWKETESGVSVEVGEEVLGWTLASAGIYVQLVHGGVPIPFICRPLLWPLDLLEMWLQYAVTWTDAKDLP